MKPGFTADIVATLSARPWRTTSRLVGLALGIAGMVAVSGLADSSARAVDMEFQRLRESSVSLSVLVDMRAALATAQVADLPGVKESIRIDRWDGKMPVDLGNGNVIQAELFGVAPSILDPSVSTIDWKVPKQTLEARKILVGREFEKLAGIGSGRVPEVVEIAGVPFVVAGVLEEVSVRSDLLFGVVVDLDSAEAFFGEPKAPSIILLTEARFTDQLSNVGPKAVWAPNPQIVQVFVAADDRELRASVTQQARLGGFVASSVVLVLGAANIATATASEVRRRTPELGLRRAIGASGRQIVILVLGETATVGLLAGLVGTWCGLLVTLGVAGALDWAPLVSPTTWVIFPVLGAGLGAAAGVLPARVAAAISPRAALIT